MFVLLKNPKNNAENATENDGFLLFTYNLSVAIILNCND